MPLKRNALHLVLAVGEATGQCDSLYNTQICEILILFQAVKGVFGY